MSDGVFVRGKCAECGQLGNFELPRHIAAAWIQHADLQRALAARADAGNLYMTNATDENRTKYREAECQIQIILDNIGA